MLTSVLVTAAIVVIGSSAINSPNQLNHTTGYYTKTAQSCGCHGKTAITSNNISVSGLPDTVTAGGTYPFRITITDPTAVKFGFALSSTAVATGGAFKSSNKYATVSATATYEVTHKSPPQAPTHTYTYDSIYWNAPAKAGTVKLLLVALCGNGKGGSASGCAISCYKNSKSIYVKIDSTLPIKISSFNANASLGKVSLNWSTAIETNVASFAVERSVDGKVFVNAGKVSAIGNTTSAHYYSFIEDASKLSGTVYYRLNAIDKDGKSAYSSVQQVVIKSGKTTGITNVYPNPLRAGQDLKLNYTSLKNEKVSVQLVNMLGKRVVSTNLTVTEGTNALSVAVGRLSAGVYNLSVVSESGVTHRQQVIIQ